MRSIKHWRSRSSTLGCLLCDCAGDGSPSISKGIRAKTVPFLGIVLLLMVFLISISMREQYEQIKKEKRWGLFDGSAELSALRHRKYLSEKSDEFRIGQLGRDIRRAISVLPKGIVQERTDLELKPLWSNSKTKDTRHKNLLAMTVGIKQKENVNFTVQKFLSENFSIMLFHYDGNLDEWNNFEWSSRAIHIVAQNQTKWWFAKRFLHPAVVSMYDYIFIWDEDLGVENFHPGGFLRVMKAEGFEISQPALHPNSTDIHHRITIRNRGRRAHRRMSYFSGNSTCTASSIGPPCTGWVEGMAPVFTRAAWQCTWHLIQNDLIHGWGMDMKLGYCAQGDRSRNIGVVDSEYVFHQGIPSLGGPSANKSSITALWSQRAAGKTAVTTVDPRSEIRRRSVHELEIFRKRWQKAVSEDKKWVDPFEILRRQRRRYKQKPIAVNK